jgi:hypothetical protein
MKMNILKQDKVASTIAIINQQLKMALNKAHSKDNSYMYYTFKGNAVEQIIDFITVRNAKSALVIDDVGLQIVNRLIQEGISDITLCLTRFPEEYLYRITYIILKSFPNIKIKIIHYKELIIMNPIKKVDLVIANTPYGAIGANISYELKDKVEYKEFINLLPANDYKRNKTKDLFNYQSEMEAINDGFEDATVTTHLTKLHRNKANDMTLDEFERSQYIDPQLDKYFEENSKKSHYAIDNPDCGKRPDTWEIGKTFAIGFRDANHHHLPYSKTAATYLWNVDKSIDFMYLVDNYNNPRADRKGTYEVSFYGVKFNTVTEFDNFIAFVYSKQGFKFLSKVMTALNVDSFIALNKFLPKVNWTRSWTVEEILRDYGYTEEEITEVMNDLNRFKGMDD